MSEAASESEPRKRLKSFRVEGLFGFFTHPIELRTDDRITIIHGPNGVGKTTVLKLIEGLLKPRSRVWRTTEFTKVEAKFLPSGTLTITPITKDKKKGIRVLLEDAGRRQKGDVFQGRTPRELPLSIVEDVVPNLTEVGRAQWHDRAVGDVIGWDEVADRYGAYLPQGMVTRKESTLHWLSEFFAGLATQFVQTQRLVSRRARTRHGRDSGTSWEHVVEGLAADLVRRVGESVRESGARGASLDQTFPKRLLEGDLPKGATEEQIRTTYQELEKLRLRLMAVGLLDAEEQVPLPKTELSEHDRKVLWYYLEDVQKKLAIHAPLLQRVELFKRIIDEKDFLYKSMILDKKHGFRFESDNGKEVPLAALSSGEQHELVLAYELLFRSHGKQLILIDEPELSLHVLWQKRFLRDMEEIAKLANLDFVIATHSPSIVNDRTDLMVELSRGDA